MTTITPFLWFDRQAEEAARFYAATFPDSRVDAVNRAPADSPSAKTGEVLTVEFTVLGLPFVGMNGGPHTQFNDAVSFMVTTGSQAETDRYWDAIVGGGGKANVCGWCHDRFGLRWQITPKVLLAAMASPDRAAAKRAMAAMMTMGKIDIAAIERAVAGG